MGEGHKKLNFSDCMGLAIGQIIGSGIMVLTGIVIGLTGHGIAKVKTTFCLCENSTLETVRFPTIMRWFSGWIC